MARGSILKEQITNKILETFPGSFVYDKVLIIPGVENSENLQIKVALTCAKVNVERGGDTALPGDTVSSVAPSATPAAPAIAEPTAEEQARVSDLLSKLGLQ